MKKLFLFLSFTAYFTLSAQDIISFTWVAEADSIKRFYIRADLQKTFSVDWGDNSQPVTYTGRGSNWEVSLPYTYGVTGTYTVSITGNTPDCFFTYLDIYENSVQSLDISRATALMFLSCGANQLTNLDVSANTALTNLACSNNQLTDLDVRNNIALSTLSCSDNQLTNLDISKNTALTRLYCKENLFTNLDVSANTALINLDCVGNQLTTLDVSANTLLTAIFCNDNQLNSLDVSTNIELSLLNCYNNAIPLADLYAASQRINTAINKRLGTQTLAMATVGLNVPVPVDTVFNGVGSTFTISKDSGTAVVNTDYTDTNGMFTFLTEGIYTVEIINPALVSNSDYPAKIIASYAVRKNARIKDIQIAGISIYPNPATNNIHIVLPEHVNHAVFTLYDMQGKVLICKEVNNKEAVSINNLASGTYIYHVGIEKESYQGKILKQ